VDYNNSNPDNREGTQDITFGRFIYRDPRFNKTIAALKRQGGNASFIAEKTERMIKDVMEGRRSLSEIGKMTRNGEHRIDNCFKVDLGSGYRMACLRSDLCLVFLFIGTHDDCCRWIEHNKGMKYEITDISRIEPVVRHRLSAGHIAKEAQNERSFVREYENSILSRLDDATLRRIFSISESDHSW
jgi:hypothetical protein